MRSEIVIVGAGFAGLGMAIQLRKHGFDDFVILERANDVGGTWRDNDYPGCACDIPSILYSFSFATSAAWTRVFPRQPEIWSYLRRCVAQYRLEDRLRLGVEVTEADFDEPSGLWRVRCADGTEYECRALILGMGPLNRPNVPALPGLERFEGATFHSSQWRHDVELRDKDVAVVGTGASAIQFVPEIAPLVRTLTVFQRTPPWVIPRADRPISARRSFARRWIPGFGWFGRKLLYWFLEIRALGFTVVPKLLATQESVAQRHLERQVPEPELRRALTPEYRMGCKRILISDDYYPALRRPNVRLVTSPIREVGERSVVTADGVEHPAGVIVFGTGFRATDVPDVRIAGRGGRALGDVWREGMSAYLGTSVAGFPNLFLLIGPNTGLGHNSMVLMMEAQYRYVLGALRLMRRRKLRALDVRADVQERYNRRLQARMARTVWASGCSSWYIDRNGKNTALWPGFTFAFRARTRRFVPRRYELIGERTAQ